MLKNILTICFNVLSFENINYRGPLTLVTLESIKSMPSPFLSFISLRVGK